MSGLSTLWPQDRLDAFWALQKRARKDGNSVISKRIPGGLGTTLIIVKIGNTTLRCTTVAEAQEVYEQHAGDQP